MAHKRRSLELFEVYAGSRQGEGDARREQEFVKPGPAMVAQTCPEARDGVEAQPRARPEPAAEVYADAPVPSPAEPAVMFGPGYLTLRVRYWAAAAVVAGVVLLVAGAYRLGGFVGDDPSADTGLEVAQTPAAQAPSRFEDLQVAGGGQRARAAAARPRKVSRPAAAAPQPSRGKRHHLVVAIYQVRDEQRAKRALQAFRTAGFPDLTTDRAGGYRRLVSPYFESVTGTDAKAYRARILGAAKTLNAQYKLGSRNDFRDCYWETVK